jgi:hypothetical protein
MRGEKQEHLSPFTFELISPPQFHQGFRLANFHPFVPRAIQRIERGAHHVSHRHRMLHMVVGRRWRRSR